jgi:hypothetical protein
MKRIFLLPAIAAVLFASCATKENQVSLLNEKASLPASFQFEKLGLKVFNSSVNKTQGTMSTLYSNEIALNNALSGNGTTQAGEVFALITWKQQADENWFGANVPSDLQSVEIIKTQSNNGTINTEYKKYAGKDLSAVSDTAQQQQRILYIISQRPSVMP